MALAFPRTLSTPRWLVYLVGSATLALVLSSATSRQLERSAPAAATLIFPFNGEARLRSVLEQLAQDTAAMDGAEAASRGKPDLLSRVMAGLSSSIGDARFYSLLGILAKRDGDGARAKALFEKALLLSKAERYAAREMFINRAEAGDFDAAIAHADILLRRWPHLFGELADPIVAMFAMPDGYAPIMARITSSPTWRGGVLARLARSPDGLALLYRVMLDLQAGDSPPTTGEISQAINAFIRAGDPQTAYRLFVLTLSEPERQLAGSVFNGRFTEPPSGKPFDWRVGNQKGVDVTLPVEGGGARLQFFDRPVTQIQFGQTLALLPGPRRIVAVISGERLVLPRGLFLSFRCPGANGSAAQLPIRAGTYSKVIATLDIEIPAEGCAVQELSIVSGQRAASWAARYNGALTIHSISVERPSE
jgi:tetratricopeptide (TPR) repeat protein